MSVAFSIFLLGDVPNGKSDFDALQYKFVPTLEFVHGVIHCVVHR